MGQGRILVIEDDFDISNMLDFFFSEQGFDVRVAPRGHEALRMCRQQIPDIVILDIMLPDMDGFTVCRELRSAPHTQLVPIIFLTQRDERSDKIAGLQLGADDYITKPFNIKELELRVRNSIERARRSNLTHALVGLPTADLVEEALEKLIGRSEWALLYVGLYDKENCTSFKSEPINDRILSYIGRHLIPNTVDECGTANDFIGYVGGSDFIIITKPSVATELETQLRERFAWEKERLLNEIELPSEANGKAGCRQAYDNMVLSVGLVWGREHPNTIEEITKAAAHSRRRNDG